MKKEVKLFFDIFSYLIQIFLSIWIRLSLSHIYYKMTTSEPTQSKSTKTLSSFFSGGIAGVVAKTAIAPIERVKFLFIVKTFLWRQTSHRQFTYRHFTADFLHIINRHGLRNLWRGNLMNVARVFPHAAVVGISTFRIFQSSITYVQDFTETMEVLLNKFDFTFVELQQDLHHLL